MKKTWLQIISTALCCAVLGVGCYSVIDFSRTQSQATVTPAPGPVDPGGKPGDNPGGETPEDPDYQVLPYEFRDNQITKYTGNATEVTLPTSYSLGKVVPHTYTFTDRWELDEYVMQLSEPYHADPNFNYETDFTKEQFNYIFTDKNGAEHVAKSLEQFDELRMQLSSDSFYPIVTEGTMQEYIAGDDIKIDTLAHLGRTDGTLKVINVPDSITFENRAPLTFAYYQNLEQINFSDTHPTYKNIGPAIVDKATNKLLLVLNGAKGTYTTPAGVTTVAEYSLFNSTKNITKLIIHSDVTAIESQCLAASKIPVIEFPAGLATIGRDLFGKFNNDAAVTTSRTLIFHSAPAPQGSTAGYPDDVYWFSKNVTLIYVQDEFVDAFKVYCDADTLPKVKPLSEYQG